MSDQWAPGAPGAGASQEAPYPQGPYPQKASHPPRPGGRGWVRGLLLAGVIALIAVSGIVLLIFLGYEIGVTALIVGLCAAILPVPVLVGIFFWLDRYEPEPLRYLVLCFFWGACVATGGALLVNSGSSVLFERSGLPDALVGVLVAPFIEETLKALFPLFLLVFRRRELSGITDGIVYCGLSATGFAMVENILYLGGYGYASGVEQYGPASGAQAVIQLFIARIVLTGFAHPLFTAMTGIGLGIAARAADRRIRWAAPLAGLLMAMMLHGAWNLMATLTAASGELLVFLYGYFAVMVPIFIVMVGTTIWLRSWEGRMTERVLPAYVRAGWLSPPEVAALGTLGRRYSARRWARRVAGDAGLKAMREYQVAATQLALLRDGVERGLDQTAKQAAVSAEDERRLLAIIADCRAGFTGRDPQAPRAVWDGERYEVTFPDGVRRTLDPPAQPVVPIPVAVVPGRPPGTIGPGYGGPGYGGPGYGYGRPPGYGPPLRPGSPPSSSPPGYGPPAYGPPGPTP
ncbi:MAG TPA: PrsW family intramembrane metalloprotease [Micromonosporaceae bacterium]|nr:PrsW family intramembrane metalloprotease [Micromonosporaceae bacterium]